MTNKERLVHVLTKELGIGRGVASDVADACTPEQLQAVTDYLYSVSQGPTKHYIDNWDKYIIMMMTAFKTAEVRGSKPTQKTTKKQLPPPPVKASPEVKEASMDSIRSFLGLKP